MKKINVTYIPSEHKIEVENWFTRFVKADLLIVKYKSQFGDF